VIEYEQITTKISEKSYLYYFSANEAKPNKKKDRNKLKRDLDRELKDML
jgi:hypothetical protein